jgi:hypothetical protein
MWWLLLLQRELNGHNYFEFEYTAKTSRYTRHSLAVVVANDGEISSLWRSCCFIMAAMHRCGFVWQQCLQPGVCMC